MGSKGNELPFKVGQLIEAKSFISGYRGSWFRCKIVKISSTKVGMGYSLEYIDFPDEKILSTRIYQKAPKTGEKHLMVRPWFPPLYHESNLPDVNTIVDVAVVVNEMWKVGDLVDWWSDGCYWTGRLRKAFGKEKFQIALLPPPTGEGRSYDVLVKDLRPALNWSLLDGWTVPVPAGIGNCRPCARIIKSVNPARVQAVHEAQDGFPRTSVDGSVHEARDDSGPSGSFVSASSSPPSGRLEQQSERLPGSAVSKKVPSLGMNSDTDVANSDASKTSSLDSAPIARVRDASTLEAGFVQGTNGPPDNEASNSISKKLKTSGSFSLNSMCPNTVETAIFDLEELVSQIKWIKRILEVGMPSTDHVRPSWKFLEHEAPSIPKCGSSDKNLSSQKIDVPMLYSLAEKRLSLDGKCGRGRVIAEVVIYTDCYQAYLLEFWLYHAAAAAAADICKGVHQVKFQEHSVSSCGLSYETQPSSKYWLVLIWPPGKT